MDAIVVDQVVKSFGSVRAVASLNMRVSRGCIYGFLGPNGAGKTTTIRMIMDIIRPDSGRIEVLGHACPADAKDRVGYMPEERGLYRKMTVARVLAYFGAIKGVPASDLTRKVPEWLRRVGLADWAGRKVEELSKGMHQKLQFAVTVINEPEVLILDEPFSGLDPVNLDLIESIILGLRDAGKTVVFSTHAMHEAERLCDVIHLINKGQTVFYGTLDEIRSRHRTHAALVELEGDGAILGQLPGVTSVQPSGRQWEVALADTADPQDLLRELVARCRVRAFQVKVPSLHQIFVQMVGGNHEQDS
jgi:ABC-2 type transport system ATP-binding protein